MAAAIRQKANHAANIEFDHAREGKRSAEEDVERARIYAARTREKVIEE